MKSSIYLAKRKEEMSLWGSENKENCIQMKFSYSTSGQQGGVDPVKQIFIRGYNELYTEFVIALPRHCKVFKVWKNEMEIYYSPLLITRRNNRSPHSNEFYVLIMNFIKYHHENEKK